MPLPDIAGPGTGLSTADGMPFTTPGRASILGGGTPSFTPATPSSSSSSAAWMPVQRTGASLIIPTATGSLQGLVCTPEEKAK